MITLAADATATSMFTLAADATATSMVTLAADVVSLATACVEQWRETLASVSLFALAAYLVALVRLYRRGHLALCWSLARTVLLVFVGTLMTSRFLGDALGLLVLAIFVGLTWTDMAKVEVKPTGKAVLITGCDRGLGYEFARLFDSLGMYVFAGVLDSKSVGAATLERFGSSRLTVIQMDVRNLRQVELAATVVEEKLRVAGIEGVWALVNNAAIFSYGEVDFIPLNQLEKVISVNVMGTIQVTQRFMHLIKAAQGRVINMASFTGVAAVSPLGPYVISKHAFEAFSNLLRKEMRKWNVRVVVVRPMGFDTGNLNKDLVENLIDELWDDMHPLKREEYGKMYIRNVYESLAAIPREKDFSAPLAAIRAAVMSVSPKNEYHCGAFGRTLSLLNHFLPSAITDQIIFYGPLNKQVRPKALLCKRSS
ncbi:PREDICTED: D-beta-hydroxybutyrate dehydrogenase, mitochondrial-like [Priapulus caudatus]|uniref:D-beta-hydroxybutyrate dehydrogenase, mitochondrial-like n=1 Tax=Priapulus caudatus TaxID=37621 RepID=A0ABM1F890_PRICU|nr:PREDICTED: D-beta-hydroxybutyrate dehydrogenase, mitochondrial-like [Priapulus caudatus]